MPIFVPTQGQGALYPLRAPQASQVQFNPLNTLGVASLIQRNRGLEQQQQAFELQQRQMDLREKLGILENQRELFKTINQQFAVGAAQNKASQSGFNTSSYGLNPEFYGNAVSTLDDQNNAFLNRALGQVGNMRTIDDAAQANNEVSRLMLDFNRNLRGNTQYQEFLRNQTAYDNLVQNIDKELGQGKTVNALRQQELYNNMKLNGEGKRNMRPSDFNLSSYIFDEEKGRESLDETVQTALNEQDFAQYATESPDGFIAIEEGKIQRGFEDAANKAYNSLKNNSDVRGIAENLAFVNGTTPEEEIRGLIEDELTNQRNETDRWITGIKLQNKARSGSNADQARIDDLRQNIIDQGFNPDPIGPMSEKEALRRIAQLSDDDKEGRFSTILEDGRLKFVYGNNVIAEYDPSGKPFYEQSPADFGYVQGQSEPAPPAQPQAQTGTQTNNTLSAQDNDTLALVEQEESAGGGNILNTDDQGQASVGPLQFRGALGNKFLDTLGIEGYDLTTKLNQKEANALNKDLSNVDGEQLINASRDFFAQELLPKLEKSIENLPQVDLENASPAVKLPLYSLAVNHSPRGQERILKRASEDLQNIPEPTEDQIINAVQDARIDYVNSLDGLSDATKQQLVDRYERERTEALNKIQTAPTTAPTQASSNKWAKYKK